MTTSKFGIAICVAVALHSAPAHAICGTGENPAVSPTTPTSDFTIHGDGTVTHNRTGLMWMRCSVGQTWNQGTGSCTGSPTGLSWQAALNAAASHDFAGYSDWRLPNKNELASIVERRCWQPSINTVVFPDTPVTGEYWTSTPAMAGSGIGALNVVFSVGSINYAFKSWDWFRARLVRSGN